MCRECRAPLLVETPTGTYFTGSLTAGILVAHQEREVQVRQEPGGWAVLLADEPFEEGVNGWDNPHLSEHGQNASQTEAWRYALGALFGPVDEFYDADHLRTLLTNAGKEQA